MIEEINSIMWHPLTWVIIISIPTALILKLYLKNKFEYIKQVNKNKDDKVKEMNTISGKIGFALKNPSLAYEHLTKEIKECDQMMNEFKDNEKMVKVWENKKKGAEFQLNIVSQIMQNQTLVDFVGADTIIPIIGGVEKKIRGVMKNVLGGMKV